MMTPESIEAFPYGDLSKYVDLGSDHWYTLTSCSSQGCSGTGPHGIIQPHLTANQTWCGGACSFKGHGSYAHWNVTSLTPLHLDPSLLCRSCGDHGFIRHGRWVQA